MRFVVNLLGTAAGLAVASWLFAGISFTGLGPDPDLQERLVPLLAVSLILGLVNAVVKPIVSLLSLPFVLLTLGLFLLVINAAMLLLTDWIARQLDIAFRVDGFWWAVAGSIVISLIVWAIERAFPVTPRAAAARR